MLILIIEYSLSDTSDDDYDEHSKDVAIFIKTQRGSKLLKLNGYKYRKTYKTKLGTRWACSSNKYCAAHLVLSNMDEIVVACEDHNHNRTKSVKAMSKPLREREKAEVVISRNGNINLIHRNFAYRKKYTGIDRSRWVCTTDKACRACVFIDDDYHVVSGLMEHTHSPPRNYKSLSDTLDSAKKTKNKVIQMMSKRGRPLIMYKKYTYSKYPYPLKHGWRWYCSKVKNCRAYILTTDTNHIIAVSGKHNHAPPAEDIQFRIPIRLPVGSYFNL